MSSPADINRLWLQAQQRFGARDIDGAAAACETVLASLPEHSGAHLMMSLICGRRDEHRRATRHALAAWPRMAGATLQHISAVSSRLMAVGEYGRAYELLRSFELPGLGPPRFLVDMSQQLANLGQYEDALRYLDAAIANGYAGEAVSYLRGTRLGYLGRFEEAAEEFERSLALNPRLAFAHRALANLDIPAGREARIARIRKALQQDPLTDVDRTYLGYALFRELDAIDDTDSAWQALEDAARAHRRLMQYDADAESALLGRLAAACGPGFVDAGDHAAGAGITPVFILGMPRTGTTLVERILGGHSQVTLCGELNDFRQQFKWASDHQCRGFIDDIGVGRLAGVDFADLGRRYLDHVAWRVPGTPYFSDKNPGNWILAGLILKALPQAKVVHLRRNPMDTCFSNFKELFAPRFYPYSYRLEEVAAHYRNYTRLMAHWHSIAPGRILDVHYEDLVTDPEGQARRLMEYCGIEYTPSQIHVEANEAPVSTASFVQVRRAIHAGNISGWRRYATQLEPLQELLGDTIS